MQCTKCHYGKLSRTKRVGLLEGSVLPFFGYFPWTCSTCKQRVLLKDRGERRRLVRDDDSGPTRSACPQENDLHQLR
ncbi:hypothetical protein [Tunturibacter empetritectus]|uniref:Uncharacterized protein n=1 Tax=Tunturiibacter lichenicola TaxID=2051959 RepID=A0A7W8N3L0_9BACT|nr:hypothetical protein [Edaphobacter lichenicola]MBB5344612.1 hypothetical protein [Edaphobacter lichenicola]